MRRSAAAGVDVGSPDPTPEARPARAGRRSSRALVYLVAVLILGGTFLGHNAASVNQSGGDTLWSTYQSLSLVEHGTLKLDEWRAAEASINNKGIIPTIQGHVTFAWPWGTSVVAAPLMAIVAEGAHLQGHSLHAELNQQVPPRDLEKALSSVLVAITAALLFLLLFWQTRSVAIAALLALIFAFATSTLSTVSRALWSHGPAMLFVTAELVVLRSLSLRRPASSEPRWRWQNESLALLLGLLAAASYAIRPTSLAVTLAIFIAILVTDWRRLPALMVGTGLGLAAFFLINHVLLGQWQHPYYTNRGGLSLSYIWFRALLGNLISPQRGLLIWSPILLFSIPGFLAALRRPRDPLLLVSALGVALHWLLVSRLDPWWAGWSVGPRLFSDVLPMFMVLMAPGLVALRSWNATRARRNGRRIAVVGFALLLSVSLFINWRAATHQSVLSWFFSPYWYQTSDKRIWDWHDPIFLR